MKLKRFDAACVALNPGKPLLTLHNKAACKLSHGAVAALGLSPESTIALHQDEENPTDWYLELNPQEGRPIPLRLSDKKSSSKALSFNATAIARAIFTSLGTPEHSYLAIPIVVNYMDANKLRLYPLLTAAANSNNNRKPQMKKAD